MQEEMGEKNHRTERKTRAITVPSFALPKTSSTQHRHCFPKISRIARELPIQTKFVSIRPSSSCRLWNRTSWTSKTSWPFQKFGPRSKHSAWLQPRPRFSRFRTKSLCILPPTWIGGVVPVLYIASMGTEILAKKGCNRSTSWRGSMNSIAHQSRHLHRGSSGWQTTKPRQLKHGDKCEERKPVTSIVFIEVSKQEKNGKITNERSKKD